jgi:phage/plasmid-associated DNA primase
LGGFITECCTQEAKDKVNATQLYKAYCQWCDDKNESKMTGTAFGRALAERGYSKNKETTGKRLIYYKNLGLLVESM